MKPHFLLHQKIIQGSDMSRIKVLIVEDEVINALLLKTQIEQEWDALCELSRTGEDSVEKVITNGFNIVIMDIKLAGKMDGIDAVREIQKSPKKDVPIIYVTASTDEYTFKKAQTTEMVDYINKPFNEKRLKDAIATALNAAS